MRTPLFLVTLLVLSFWGGQADAIQPDEVLDDPVLEQRARDLAKGFRCVVCQSENIDESNVDLARDMRLRIRGLLIDGKSDADVKEFMVDRYGDFVLMDPPVKSSTYVLWFGPLGFFLAGLGGLVVVFFLRRSRLGVSDGTLAHLSPQEQADLKRVLEDAEKSVPASDKESPAR